MKDEIAEIVIRRTDKGVVLFIKPNSLPPDSIVQLAAEKIFDVAMTDLDNFLATNKEPS